MLIGEVIEAYPELAEVLAEDFGFHCLGCFAAGMETLEQGAEVHGMGEEEVEEMIKTLNGILEDARKEKVK